MSKLFQKLKSLTHCPSEITVNLSNITNVKQKVQDTLVQITGTCF